MLFDTLRLSLTLRDKGHFTPEQAETLAQALGEATHEDLATKADFAILESAFKSEMAALKVEMGAIRAELGSFKAEMGTVKAEIANLATKAEIANLATKAELAGLRAELKTDLAELKADILKWIVGAIGFQTAAMLGTVVGLVKIFAK